MVLTMGSTLVLLSDCLGMWSDFQELPKLLSDPGLVIRRAPLSR